MTDNPLKTIRVGLAVLVFSGLTLAFVDFRGFLPHGVGHALAHTQFVPGLVSLLVGGMGAGIFVVGLLLALLFGRIYCSAICPLGILQDITARIAGWLRRKGKFLPQARAWTKTRHFFLWGVVLAAFAGWGGFALALLDPYSGFGRIASMLFRPLVALANNAIVGPASALGITHLYRVDPAWAGAGLLVFPAVFLTTILVMSALKGRLYCNTVCPVGTALGLLSRFSVFRISIDKAACTKCGDCLRSCKAQCIDLKTGSIDASRCVACFNCVGACDTHGIRYRLFGRTNNTTTTSETGASARLQSPGPTRRAFLNSITTGASMGLAAFHARAEEKEESHGKGHHQGNGRGRKPYLKTIGADSPAICPPGAADVPRFLDRCTACHLCISACPTHVLQPSFMEYGLEGLFRPRLDYSQAYCLFECTRCGEVCPDGAITRINLAEKSVVQIGVADLYMGRCIVKTNGTDCAACSEHCPTKAITTEPYHGNPDLRRPVLNQDLCIGCGACEYACPARPEKAILVTGRKIHATAERLIEKKATAPDTGGEFPF